MKKLSLIGKSYFQYLTLISAFLLLPFLKGIAQVSLTTLGAAYTQNFDGLVNSGTSSSVPSGWAFVETGTNANTTYAAGTGSGNSGETFSFGASSANDRAFGSLASGSLQTKIGASFVNNTGSTITSLAISYVGEEWRLGVQSRTDQMNFEYSLNATSLTSGTWLPVTALNFVTPNTSTVVGAVNGNLTGNKTSISSTINSLAIAVGGTVWVRWTDVDITGSDDGLAIDDFSLTPSGSAPIPPTKFVITTINPSSPIAGSGFSVTVQAQDATNTAQNVIANTSFSLSTNGNAGVIGGTITGTINAGSNSVIISGVTLATGGTNVNLTASRTGGDMLAAGTSATFNVTGLATHLEFIGVPSSGYISTNIAAFTVEARRADNSVDDNYTGNIIVSKASGPGTLSGTTSVAAVAGVATFSALQFNQVGNYSLNATSGALTPTTSASIVISPSPVTWDFTTNASATNVPSNLSVSVISQGNNNGTTTMLNNGVPSSGYTGASGGNNAGAAARIGAINTGANGSAYFEFTLTPDPNYIVTLNGMSFGSRSTGTGPAAFSIRSSVQNFTTNIGTGSLLTTSTWSLSNPSISSTSSNAGSPVTFRIYGHSGSGGAQVNTANWRIDDVLLNLSVTPCSQPNISVNSGSICSGNSFTINPTGGITYSVSGNNFTVSPTTTTSYTVTGADAIGCTNTAISAVSVNTVPVISVNSGAICSGNSFTISPNGASTYTVSGGVFIVSPTTATSYTVTGTSAQGCLSSNQAISSVDINALPNISVNANPTSICNGSSSTLTGNAGISYVWNTGATTSSIMASPSVTTDYTVTGTDGNGCSNMASLTLTVNNCPGTTSLTPVSCGTTVTSLDDYIYYHAVTGATNYKVEVVSAQQSFSVVNVRNRTVPDFKLSWIAGTQYGRTYTIRVSAYVSGVWRTFGPACTVTTASVIPTTQLSAGSCGVTLGSLDQTLNFAQVAGATNYRFEITNTSQPLSIVSVRNNTVLNLKMSWFSGIQFNNTYDIRIGAYVNGAWEPYGPVCQVTTPQSAPTPSLVASACGATVATLGQVVNFTTVSGATNYRVLVTNATQSLSAVNTRNNTQATFALSYIPNTITGRTYDVSVAALVGGVWGSYGPVCQLTAGSSSKDGNVTSSVNSRTINSQLTIEEESIEFNVYPNPNNGLFNIELTTLSQVIITNTLGEIVLNQTMEVGKTELNLQSQSSGVYFVKVIQNNKQKISKIIKE